jgi:hypothetical protein
MSLFPGLVLAGAVYGVAVALVFRRFTEPELLRRTVNRIVAHVLEFRLFLDEPVIIMRAQRDLIRENIRLLRQIALPCLILAIPAALLYGPLDRHFGYGPLRVGEPVVASVPMESGLTELKAPPGIVVETPGVRVLRTRQISWRVRPVSAVHGDFPRGVDVRYPRSTILHLHWIVWFFVMSTLTAWIAPSVVRI